MGIQIERRKRDRVFTTMVMDSEVDQAILPSFVDKRHNETGLQLAIAAVTGEEVAAVNSRYDFSDEKANLTDSLRNTRKNCSAMFIAITREQVARELLEVALGDKQNPGLSRV